MPGRFANRIYVTIKKGRDRVSHYYGWELVKEILHLTLRFSVPVGNSRARPHNLALLLIGYYCGVKCPSTARRLVSRANAGFQHLDATPSYQHAASR
jgi:hypothetical protein